MYIGFEDLGLKEVEGSGTQGFRASRSERCGVET